MNILIVDDEALVLERAVRKIGRVLPLAQLYSFSDAEEALECAHDIPFDIAFLDINMRFMNGLAMAQALTELRPELNIIFCTGYSEYALDAHAMYCSAYLLKPLTEGKIREAIGHLRYPLPEEKRLKIRCFGNFEVFCDGQPIVFQRSKTKELLAYLVDRNGKVCTRREIVSALFNRDDRGSHFDNLRLDLLKCLKDLDLDEVVNQGWGTLGINRESVQCDYFDYLDDRMTQYAGEYMAQYEWARSTADALAQRAAGCQ